LFKKYVRIFIATALVLTITAGCTHNVEEPAKEVTAKEVVKDERVRKALSLAINRKAIVEEVTKGGELPAAGFVPPGVSDSKGNDFRAVSGDFGIDPNEAMIEEAQNLLAEAGFPNGEGFPILDILYNTNEQQKAIAEAIQEMWKQNLNIDSTISNQEWGVFMENRFQGNFTVATGAWFGDYPDPMTFLDMFTSYSGNNVAFWQNEEFDNAIEESKTLIGAERDEKLYKAEKLMMDDSIIMPIFYYTSPIMVQNRVSNWEYTSLGQWYFGEASTDNSSLVWNLSAEPNTLDPGYVSSKDGGHIVNNTFEGLMREVGGEYVPAIAESYEVSEDQTTYTFHLRDAAWSDGKPVTASDFEYAWKRAMSPEVASWYGYQMFYIKGAMEYYDGTGSVDDVGIEAIDDKTFKVELVGPTPYFLELTAFFTYMPLREDIVEQDPEGWATNPELAISNGPFVVSDYKMGNILLTPNEEYWNRDAVELDQIEVLMILDQLTQLTAMEAGEIDVIETVPNQEIPRLLVEDDRFQIRPALGTYFYVFNLK
jgi:ABC-type oligopeptide transport system substrate-binding subunit